MRIEPNAMWLLETQTGTSRFSHCCFFGMIEPYAISYRSIAPRRGEAENLLVPVCISASHIAYGSIRMEPVFMILGQSAATAAAMALDSQRAVQDVPYAELRARLLKDNQILEYSAQ